MYFKQNFEIGFSVPIVLDKRRLQCFNFVFCQLNMSRVWKLSWGGVFGLGERAKRDCGTGAVHSQHGTGVEESLHPCTKGYCPKLGPSIFPLIATHVPMTCWLCCKYVLCYSYFSPLQINSKQPDKATKHALMPSPVQLMWVTFYIWL